MGPHSPLKTITRNAVLGAVLVTASGTVCAQSLALPAWNATLPRTVAFAGSVGTGAASLYFQANSFMALLLRPWKKYARQKLLPEWGESLDLPALPYENRRDRKDAFLPSFAQRLIQSGNGPHHFRFGMEQGVVPVSPLLPEHLNRLRINHFQARIEQSLFTPTYAYELGPHSRVGVSAVLAYQNFSTYGLGAYSSSRVFLNGGYDERAFGTGLRFGVRGRLVPGLFWGATYQTRIDMDPFYSLRGVYSEPGRFDIPASAGLQLVMKATGDLSVSMKVRHINYSDIDPFASALLPNRFLALLGDGTSPTFAWQDLTVYRIGWQWQSDEGDLTWGLNWSTTRQPKPTSPLLANALSREFADSYWTLGLRQATGDFGHIFVSASYTPSDYFLSLYGEGFEPDSVWDRLELEARWTVRF